MIIKPNRMIRIPISWSPLELFAEILLLCPPLRYDSICEQSYIIHTSQVCHHWRSTALFTPALWTFILFLCTQLRHFFSGGSMSSGLACPVCPVSSVH